MATLMARRLLWVLLVAASGGAQDWKTTVPTWPDSGRIPRELSDRYVFLTKDKHTIVVLVPESPEAGMSGQKRIVKVPLWNNLAPAVSVFLTRAASGTLSYQYTISNGLNAQDAIGAFSLIVPSGSPDLQVKSPSAEGRRLFAGGIAPNGPAVARQAIFPTAPLGRYLTWFRQDNNVIPPGGTLGGFCVESSFRPGLTTAWFSAGKLVEFDQSWPREVFEQLLLLEDRQWREKYDVTVGPMFPPDTPREAILESFQLGLDRMVKTGSLNPSSAFTAEAIALLRELSKPGSPDRRSILKARPGTNTEKAVAAALRFSLNMELPE